MIKVQIFYREIFVQMAENYSLCMLMGQRKSSIVLGQWP